VVRILTCLALAAATTAPALADDNPDYLPGPWHFRAVSCVDGVAVTFATGLGIQPLFARGTASVVHYQDSAGNNIMAAEHRGDRVQVCYLGGPAPTKYCNPDQDDRGRNYRVYDYRQHQQYWGGNSEHDCGGA